jgi:hypothetical protein
MRNLLSGFWFMYVKSRLVIEMSIKGLDYFVEIPIIFCYTLANESVGVGFHHPLHGSV